MSIAPGTRLGPYEIVAALASGGMGDVYLAIDARLNRRVALKVLRDTTAGDPDRLARFEQEARSASALNHPNIVTIYDVGHEGAVRYIAMEFVEGRTVRALIGTQGLRPVEALRIAAQVAGGLAKAHEAGVAHRDLKPENIMVTNDGYAKVLDFGLAKLSAPEHAFSDASTAVTVLAVPDTSPGVVLGTVGYMSPEQARGLPADARADQFALGAILYEMLTGRRAFPGHSAIAVLASIIRDEPHAVSTVVPVPPVVEGIVSRCLAKDPVDRFTSTRELADRLDSALRELVSERRWHPTPAVSPDTTMLTTRGHVPSSIAVLPFADLSPEHDQEYFCDGLADELISYLGGLEGGRIASRSAAFQFKGQSLDTAEIGRRLNVGAIIEGSVRKAGNRLRVTVQLTNTRDGYQLWSERYNRDMDDVFAIQDDIAKAIVSKLKLPLVQSNMTGALTLRARRRPEDLEAYHEYLRGRFHWNERTPAAFEQALRHFQRAVERAPDYSLAQVGLADTFNVLGYYNAIPPCEAYPRAKAASAQALEAEPALSEAHASQGFSFLFFDRDYAGAEDALRRAITLDASYASAHQWLAWVLFVRERFDEALENMQHAYELDPLAPIIGCHLAYSLELVGRRGEAAERLRTTLTLNPSFPLGHWFLGLLRLAEGHHDEAIQSLHTAADTSDGRVALGYLGYAYAAAARRDDALAVLDRLHKNAQDRFTSPLDFALVHAGLREHDAVFAWLDRAFDVRVSDLSRVNLLPWPDEVRADARFLALLRRLHLPLSGGPPHRR